MKYLYANARYPNFFINFSKLTYIKLGKTQFLINEFINNTYRSEQK